MNKAIDRLGSFLLVYVSFGLLTVGLLAMGDHSHVKWFGSFILWPVVWIVKLI